MTVLKAIVKDGKIEMVAPEDWPEGTEVLIEPIPHGGSSCLREQDWPNTPEGIARQLALMDQIEPLLMTTEEEADFLAARDAQKDFEKVRFDDQAESLRMGWE